MGWQPQYCAAADLANWLPGVSQADPSISVVIEAASRAIDQATNRQFGQTAGQTRSYIPKWHLDRWYVDNLDDMPGQPAAVNIVDDSGAVLQPVTAWVMTPRNAPNNNRPFEGMEFYGVGVGDYGYGGYGFGFPYPLPVRRLVQVTGVFGWSAIPQPIQLATQIQAARFYERQSTVMPLTSQRVDDVAYSFSQLDPDIEASIAPFRRQWGAV